MNADAARVKQAGNGCSLGCGYKASLSREAARLALEQTNARYRTPGFLKFFFNFIDCGAT